MLSDLTGTEELKFSKSYTLQQNLVTVQYDCTVIELLPVSLVPRPSHPSICRLQY